MENHLQSGVPRSGTYMIGGKPRRVNFVAKPLPLYAPLYQKFIGPIVPDYRIFVDGVEVSRLVIDK